MSFLIADAYATTTTAAGGAGAPHQQASMISSFVMIGLLFVVFYLFLWRPQSKRAKEHRELVGGIAKGDEVVTTGGIMGKVTRMKDDYLVMELTEGVEIKIQKNSVAATLPKGTLKAI